jgi:D-alanyl-lipoteichoic acid acyltransferase DltB (MBOAT superfamily)
MAIGLALIFGITLPYNFNSPYKANSIIDFWRRWHMTLSRFLKEYIYIPLGGSKKGNRRQFLNLLLTMFLAGLWHGAGWTFVMWGLLHGAYIVVNHGWRALAIAKPILIVAFPLILRRALTFIAIVIAWVVFRSENIPTAINIISSMFDLEFTTTKQDTKNIISLSIGLFLVWFAPNSNEIFSNKNNNSAIAYRWSTNIISPIAFSTMAFIAVIYLARAQEFLYFQF